MFTDCVFSASAVSSSKYEIISFLKGMVTFIPSISLFLIFKYNHVNYHYLTFVFIKAFNLFFLIQIHESEVIESVLLDYQLQNIFSY